MTKRIGIVVGETSGDILGAGLIKALQQSFPDARFEGIGGPRMLALGFRSFFPQDRLAVMGLIEPLKRLPELLRIRKYLKHYFVDHPPDVFIGIDAPDFNLNLESYLRGHGVKTVHYVSPSVWAWRQKRIHKIARAVNRVLTLFPFEKEIYEAHQIPVTFVGHPLADEFPLEPKNPQNALADLGITRESKAKASKAAVVVALLPGSRSTEVQRLADVFLRAAHILLQTYPSAQFLIPSASDRRHQQLSDILQAFPGSLPVHLIQGQSHQVMTAADVVVMASGTTTLEAMLLKKPMVITYKMSPVGFWIIKKLVKVKWIGLPNLLANKSIVPELIQEQASAENIAAKVKELLEDQDLREGMQAEFYKLHQTLRKDASLQAAKAVAEVMGEAMGKVTGERF